MEFNYRLADIFPNEISVVCNDLVPKGSPGVAKFGAQVVKDRVGEMMDVVGKASALAQNLHQIITSADKLRTSDMEQIVYFLCDFTANQVVGLLKIGRKKLFVYDAKGVQHELNPLCILDFYVHESRQRVGCGKVLFDAMLLNESAEVKHLAIDRPSDKFLFFLKKHYKLSNMIPQVNNFVIFDGFFDQRTDYSGKKPRWGGLDQVEEKSKSGGMVTEFQDSSSYNTVPQLHLRNTPHYTPLLPNLTQQGGGGGNSNGGHNSSYQATNGAPSTIASAAFHHALSSDHHSYY